MTLAFVVVFAILTLSLSQTITPQESIDICSDL